MFFFFVFRPLEMGGLVESSCLGCFHLARHCRSMMALGQNGHVLAIRQGEVGTSGGLRESDPEVRERQHTP